MTDNTETNGIDFNDVYMKHYTMRRQGEDGLNTVVTIPPIVIQKEARKRNITPEEFIRTYKAVATFNGFPGVLYRFEKIGKSDNIEETPENNTELQAESAP